MRNAQSFVIPWGITLICDYHVFIDDLKVEFHCNLFDTSLLSQRKKLHMNKNTEISSRIKTEKNKPGIRNPINRYTSYEPWNQVKNGNTNQIAQVKSDGSRHMPAHKLHTENWKELFQPQSVNSATLEKVWFGPTWSHLSAIWAKKATWKGYSSPR